MQGDVGRCVAINRRSAVNFVHTPYGWRVGTTNCQLGKGWGWSLEQTRSVSEADGKRYYRAHSFTLAGPRATYDSLLSNHFRSRRSFGGKSELPKENKFTTLSSMILQPMSSEIKIKEWNDENSIEKGGNEDGCGWLMMDDALSSAVPSQVWYPISYELTKQQYQAFTIVLVHGHPHDWQYPPVLHPIERGLPSKNTTFSQNTRSSNLPTARLFCHPPAPLLSRSAPIVTRDIPVPTTSSGKGSNPLTPMPPTVGKGLHWHGRRKGSVFVLQVLARSWFRLPFSFSFSPYVEYNVGFLGFGKLACGRIQRYKQESPKSEAMGKLNDTALYSLLATHPSYRFNASPNLYSFSTAEDTL